jgi:hypothetical protein
VTSARLSGSVSTAGSNAVVEAQTLRRRLEEGLNGLERAHLHLGPPYLAIQSPFRDPALGRASLRLVAVSGRMSLFAVM